MSDQPERPRSLTEPPLGNPGVPIPPRPNRPRPGGGTPPMSQAPEARPERPRRDDEDDLERAMEAAMKDPAPPRSEVSLKRQWDEDLEAELAAAMEGFSPDDFDVASKGRTRAADRAHVDKGAVGQEDRGRGPQQARVIGVKGKSVFLDLGAKSEGVVPLEQFDEDKIPAAGDMIEVLFDHFDPAEGLLHMSLRGAAVEASWENLRKGLTVEARVTKTVKGGVEVDVNGIRGFMPISQIDLNRVEDGSEFLNQKVHAVVTEANQREKNLVVSRREYLEREREVMREKTWAELEEGQIREGTVRSVKPFGAFVDLGGVDGLLHVADMSWVRTQDASQLVTTGQQVQVKVLKIDRETSKINLGLKQLMPSPWDTIEDKYGRGQTVAGKVTRLMDFGAFVELEPGIEGLIHISELSPKRVVRVKDIIQPGQDVEVRILQVDADAKKISLSLRPLPQAPTPEPEEEDDGTPKPPRPERKVPLRGGLGDRDPDPLTPKP